MLPFNACHYVFRAGSSERNLKTLLLLVMTLQEQYEFAFKTVVEMFEKALRGPAHSYENLSEV